MQNHYEDTDVNVLDHWAQLADWQCAAFDAVEEWLG